MIICFAFYVQCVRAGETTFGTVVASMRLIMYNYKLHVRVGAYSAVNLKTVLCFIFLYYQTRVV